MLGSLKNIFGHKSDVITAPISGKVISLKEVKDAAFSEGVLGQGVAVVPSGSQVTAPVTGTVAALFETKHAIALETESGVQVMIHMGMDTVKLQGKYFTVNVKQGDQVKKGDILASVEWDNIKEEGYDITTPVVICNSDDYKEIKTFTGIDVKNGDTIMEVIK